jgi:hypothetical protein
MANLVVSGALLRCSMGSATSTLLVPGAGGPIAGGLPIATTADNKAIQNIRPFGLCSSPANPGAGPNKPPPLCIPVIVTPWIPGSPTVRASNVPVLNQTCQCHCQWTGVISILTPGQQGTTVS